MCCCFFAAEQKSIPPVEGPRFRIQLVNQQQFCLYVKVDKCFVLFCLFFFNIITLSNLEIINYYRTQYERACLHYFSILDSQKMNINLFLRSTMH